MYIQAHFIAENKINGFSRDYNYSLVDQSVHRGRLDEDIPWQLVAAFPG